MNTIRAKDSRWDALPLGALFQFPEDNGVHRKTGENRYQDGEGKEQERKIYSPDVRIVRLEIETTGPNRARFCALPVGTAFVWHGESPIRGNELYKWSEDLAGPFPPPAANGGQSAPAAFGSVRDLFRVPNDSRLRLVEILEGVEVAV